MGFFALTALTALTSFESKGGVLLFLEDYISIYLSPASIKNRDFAMFLWQIFVFFRVNVKKNDTIKITAIML